MLTLSGDISGPLGGEVRRVRLVIVTLRQKTREQRASRESANAPLKVIVVRIIPWMRYGSPTWASWRQSLKDSLLLHLPIERL